MLDLIDRQNKSTTYIAYDTTIEADLTSASTVDVYGSIKGKVTIGSLLSVHGNIIGQVETNDLIIRYNGQINGDCHCFFDCLIDQEGKMIGNIDCHSIEIKGHIRGNVIAQENVIIRKGGNVDGNITCRSLVVDDGGIINGAVRLVYR